MFATVLQTVIDDFILNLLLPLNSQIEQGDYNRCTITALNKESY